MQEKAPRPVKSRPLKTGVGSALAHDSAAKHVSGAATYLDDIAEVEGTLHVQIALSSIAHGRITALDLAAVRAAPGVVDVVTAADVPGCNDVSPVGAGDDPLLADGLVEYHGQAIFAVAATTLDAARRAARLARVEYQPLPALITVDEAAEAMSLLGPPVVMTTGDVEAALAAAPRRIAGRFYIGGQEHFYLEGQGAYAIPGEDGDMTVHSSSQHPSEIQHKVAEVLGLAAHAVTVEVRRMGGGFGGKESQGNLPACVAALVARRTGRPAKVVYDRDDDMRVTGKRHDFRIDYEAGFDGDGKIRAVRFRHWVRCGMSWDLSAPVADRAMLHADNAYYLPAVEVTSYRLKTHTPSNTAFRGFGGPQGMIGIERVIDHIAAALRREPLEVRRANYYPDRENGPPALRRAPYGMEVTDSILRAMTDRLVETADYARRRAAVEEFNRTSPILKRGLALTPVKFGISFTKSFLNQAGALVHIYSDGSVGLNHGGTEMGQGLYVKVAQVLAEELGVEIDRIKITATTTGKVPNTSATAASSGSDLNGMAARDAARKLKERIGRFIAREHGVGEGAVRFLPGRIEVGRGAKAASVAFDEAVQAAYMARVPLSATGFYATPGIEWDAERMQGRPFFYFAYGVAVSEAIVDTLTGESRVLRADIVHDVGRSLNPAIDRGQIEGGYVQGLGWLTTEELVYGADGRLLTHAPSTYKIPTAFDRPPVLNIELFDSGGNPAETIYRSKAVGEPPLMLAISGFLAISDAIAAAVPGAYPGLDAPATPERVLMTLRRLRASI